MPRNSLTVTCAKTVLAGAILLIVLGSVGFAVVQAFHNIQWDWQGNWVSFEHDSDPADADLEVTINESRTAAEWEALKQRFAQSNVPLTSQQEVQFQAANTKLQTELTQEFQARPGQILARFVALALLPSPIRDGLAESLLGQSIISYLRSVDQILTPAQRQVWERGFSEPKGS